MNLTGSVTLNPGTYCGNIQITSNADVELNPGVYVFDAISVQIAGGAKIRGDGVTFYYTSDSRAGHNLTIAGGAKVELSAPTSGEYQGILFYADPDASPNASHSFGGGSTMNLKGVIYAPSQTFDFNGGASADGLQVMLLARKIEMHGNSFVSITSDWDIPLPKQFQGARLVQ